MASPEYQLQVHVVRYLRGKVKSGKHIINTVVPFPSLVVFACHQGRREDEGFFLQELGVLAGVSDLLMIAPNGFMAGIELKVGKNKESDYQKDFGSKLITCGHHYAVCRSVAEVRDMLVGWGLVCHNRNALEPPRPIEEQRKAVHAFYGRPDTHVKTVEEVREDARGEDK